MFLERSCNVNVARKERSLNAHFHMEEFSMFYLRHLYSSLVPTLDVYKIVMTVKGFGRSPISSPYRIDIGVNGSEQTVDVPIRMRSGP